jgi:hypothetical protein
MGAQMKRWRALPAVVVFSLCGFLAGCGGGSSSAVVPPPVPAIQNLDSSTSPSSPVNLPIEINGTGFQGAPGQVIFTQGSLSVPVTPSTGGWSDTGIVAVVPAGNGTTNFTTPGTVAVTVKTTGGTSNSVNLTLVANVTFDVNNVTWTTTTPLPTPLTGLRAVAVPSTSNSTAYVVVTGGFNGSANTTTVLSNTIAPNGTLGASWNSIADQPLPVTLAHQGMVEADPGNSLVPVGSRFIYVLGGQLNSAATPGGVNTVYMAPVDPTTGAVGAWTALSSTLPQSLIGPAVTLYNGYVYVVGGLTTSSAPASSVYSAPVESDGTLGPWTTSGNSYPVPVAFATTFGFAGKLYVLDGGDQNSTAPNAQSLGGVTDVRIASAVNGVVGAWTSTSPTIKDREKHITWLAFGQIIDAEGVYSGNPGSLELERTIFNPDATLASWNGITASSVQINANVYNAAAIVSPLLSPTNAPRFLLLGGQKFVTLTPGPLSSTVYVNSTP